MLQAAGILTAWLSRDRHHVQLRSNVMLELLVHSSSPAHVRSEPPFDNANLKWFPVIAPVT